MTPAPVDHDARRAQLSDVLVRVVDERGLEGASIRAVAAAAGVSIGTVQHYFPTKDDLLRHAYRRSEAMIEARIERRLEGVDDPREALRGILLELLPLDAERLFAIRVAAGFAVRGLYEPALEREVGADLQELRGIVTGLLDSAGVRRPGREAIALLALVDGLTDQLLYRSSGLTPANAVAVLDASLEHLDGRRAPTAG
jgi:AcrR family transcriptional regulator